MEEGRTTSIPIPFRFVPAQAVPGQAQERAPLASGNHAADLRVSLVKAAQKTSLFLYFWGSEPPSPRPTLLFLASPPGPPEQPRLSAVKIQQLSPNSSPKAADGQTHQNISESQLTSTH